MIFRFALCRFLHLICEGEALEIATKILFLTTDATIEKLNKVNWQSFRFKVKLFLTQKTKREQKHENRGYFDFIASFNLVHFVILAQKPELLKFLLDFPDQVLTKVNIENESKLVIREESWIFGASSAHLAAKFFPQGLDLILSKENICKALINCKAGPKEAYPLHVAALSSQCLSVQ